MPTHTRRTRKSLQQKSSASDLLTGSSYHKKQIAKITRGTGTSRTLHFTDGSKRVISRGEVAELAKLRGLMIYRGKYLAGDRNEKRRMVTKSRARQRAIAGNYQRKLMEELKDLPASLRGMVQRELRRVQQLPVGSPLIGERPASTSTGKSTFSTAKKAGVTFRTIRKGNRTYVIPMQN